MKYAFNSRHLLRAPSRSLALALAFALGGAACGGSDDSPADGAAAESDDGSEGNLTGGEQNPSNAEGELPVASGGLPLDSGGAAAGGTSLNVFELIEGEQCRAGFLPDDASDEQPCNATFGGACFSSDEAACECAGCGEGQCQIAESFPTQISCASTQLGGCDYQVFDICYDTAEAACAAAGCVEGACTVLESYPAQISCQ